MKVSDYIVEFLIKEGVTDVFGYPGGMVAHLMNSFDKYKDKSVCIRTITNRHLHLLQMAMHRFQEKWVWRILLVNYRCDEYDYRYL